MIYMRGKKVINVSKMAKKSRFKLVMLCTEGSKKRWGGGLRAQCFRHPLGDYRHSLKISLKKTRQPLEEILKPPLFVCPPTPSFKGCWSIKKFKFRIWCVELLIPLWSISICKLTVNTTQKATRSTYNIGCITDERNPVKEEPYFVYVHKICYLVSGGQKQTWCEHNLHRWAILLWSPPRAVSRNDASAK